MGECKFSDTCTVLRAKACGEGRYTKQKGELGELVFVLKAASLGLGVCKPYGDSLPFDFVVVTGERTVRVQVKSAFTHSRRGYTIHVGFGGRGQRHIPYTADDIDFFAAYVVAHDAWYIIPVGAIAHHMQIRVYPEGTTKRGCGRFEQFREAWDLIIGKQ